MKNRFLFIPLAVGGMALLVYVTMLLWNGLMPNLFHLTALTFWQTAGLMLLARLVFGFGGFRGHHGMHHGNGFRKRWEKMSPEEREKFRAHMKHHHHHFHCERPEEHKSNEEK